MIIYLCIRYESNTLIFSKDIERKPFFVRLYGLDVQTNGIKIHQNGLQKSLPSMMRIKIPSHFSQLELELFR